MEDLDVSDGDLDWSDVDSFMDDVDISDYSRDLDDDVTKEMSRAVYTGNLQKVKEMVAKYGLSYHRDWRDGCRILRDALSSDKMEIAEFLIAEGAKVINDDKEMCILHEVVGRGCRCLPMVKLLLAKGASVNSRNKRGDTPLHCVKTLAIAKVLFSHSEDSPPDVNARNDVGLTPLHEAAMNGKVHLAKFLLDRGASVDVKCTARDRQHGACEGYTALHGAVRCDNGKMVDLLLEKGANLNSSSKEGTPLHIACVKKSLGRVIQLLDHGADMEATDENGKTPIFRAIESGHVGIVEALLNKGAELKPSPRQLYDSLTHKCPELVEILLNHGGDPNERVEGQTALLYTVSSFKYQFRSKALETVRLLLAHGADVNARTAKTGKTALMLAIQLRFFDVIPILLDYDAKFKTYDSGETLLHLCAQSVGKPRPAFRAILERGADINARNEDGQTPLHFAAAKNNPDAVEGLLQWPDVDVDARDNEGYTPLGKAASKCNPDSVSVLLKYGADVNIANKGKTPVQAVEKVRSSGSSVGRYHYHLLRGTSMALRSHVAKLEIAGLYVKERNRHACKKIVYTCEEQYFEGAEARRYIDETAHDPKFVKRCEDEVSKMKNEKVGNSCISYHDVLSHSNNRVALYARNAAVSDVMNSGDCLDKFPLYGPLIQARLRRGERRVGLLEKASASLMNILQMPHVCIDIITDFLTNEDLKKCSQLQ